ncbi:ABC transporter substrate-binding protein [Streptomyces sp. NPDC052396]|uniref:ABC transporter substrate-binding protein n=1 Tax=Streptomyces sp. NPDC052396 TaxID=3365689 RepID=UPI0037D93E8E
MPGRRSAVAALVAAALWGATGCGSPAPAHARNEAGAGAGAAGYPVSMDNCGQRTAYTKAPRRVVVMNGASVAEVSSLLALGLGDHIVANVQSYGRSEVKGRARAIAALPTGGLKLNDALEIPREAMLGLRPDLVLSPTSYGFDAGNGVATRKELAAVGANSYVSPGGCDQDTSHQTIADSYALLRDLGRIFRVSDRAERLISASRKAIDGVAAKVGGRPAPKVMVIFSSTGHDLSYIAAHGVFNDILARAGGQNAFASAGKAPFADLSKERVAAEPVDALVVIGCHDSDPAGFARMLFKEFPQWPAARNNRYTVLSDSLYLGPSNDLAVRAIARMLHPDAFRGR